MTKRRIRPLRQTLARQRSRDQRGSSLLFVIIIIVVCGTTVSAGLQYADTAMNAQTTIEEKQADLQAGDNALVAAEQVIRQRSTFGREGVGSVCEDTDPAEADTVFEEGGVVVTCYAVEGSGLPGGDAPLSLPNAILALGAQQPGNATALGTDANIPFCTDWHAPDNSNECEASIHVGPGASDEDGALTATSTGPENPDVVRTNGAIDIRDGKTRFFHVEGRVLARWSCDDEQTGSPLRHQLQSGYVDGDPPSYDRSATYLQCDQGGELIPEPDYQHALWNYVAAGAVPPHTPGRFHNPASVPACQGTTGVTTFEPGYYGPSTTNALNDLFVNCSGALFWFKPGIYYFDLAGSGWNSAPRGGAMVVGGTPLGWSTGTSQVDKILIPNGIADSAHWDVGDESGEAEAMRPFDGQYGWATLDPAPAQTTLNASLNLGDMTTPIPNNGVAGSVAVSQLHLDVSYAAPTPSAYAAGYPKIEVWSDNWTTCSWSLPQPLPATLETVTLDLTKGCVNNNGFTNATRSTPSFPAGVNLWNDKQVNSMRVRLLMRRASDDVQSTIWLDGIQLRADYTGRAAPTFPEACDETEEGVQWILGGDTKINWGAGSAAWAELCGSRRKVDFDNDAVDEPYGFAIYALSEAKASAPVTYRSADKDPAGFVSFTEGGLGPFTAAGSPGCPPPSTMCPHAITRIGDGRYAKKSWGGSGVAIAGLQLPNNVSDRIPPGSTILRVRIKVRHSERTAGISKITVRMEPTIPSSGSVNWSTDQLDAVPLHLGPSTQGDHDVDNSPPGEPEWEDWHWGVYDLQPSTPGTQHNANWPHERLLKEKIRTPEGINGANVVVEFHSTTGGAKEVWLDGIEVEVDYRPPGTLQPLRGCATTRVARNPGTNPAVGVDWDWGRMAGGSLVADSAYSVGASATSGADDNGACAVLRIARDVRFHVEGSIFAPTAAIDLRGNDNDASFVSGGIIARHVTAYRWRKGGNIPAFGGDSTQVADRHVVLTSWLDTDGDGDGDEKLQDALVTIEDNSGYDVGAAVSRDSYRREDGQ